MHGQRFGIQGQEMLFILDQAADLLAESVSGISRVLAARFEPGLLWVLLFPDSRQFGGDLLLLPAAEQRSSAPGCLWTRQRGLGVAGKRKATAALSPSCPSVTVPFDLAHSAVAQVL